MLKTRLGTFAIISLLFVNAAHAQVVARQIQAEAAMKQQVVPPRISPLAGCTPTALTIPTTRTGTLTTSSCYNSLINTVEDIYTFTGTAGQTITVDYSSTSYEVFLWFEGLVSYSDGTIQSSFLSSGASRSKFTYTFKTTRTYTLETQSLFGPGEGFPYTGNYTVAITSDTGYFTFFSATNVEIVIKVLDACPLNSRYWVFAGGLTDVAVTLTVRDTKLGTTKTYTNPLGVAFQPIQDTNALAVCP